MISIDAALALVKENALPVETESIELMESGGRILAQSVTAPVDSPVYTNSAMDGYAVLWDDVKAVGPDHSVTLSIIGESQAGYPYPGEMGGGQAVQISTGAMVPSGCDAVIPIEDCLVKDKQVSIGSVRKQNQHIRFRGEEFKVGFPLLDPGITIGSGQIALLASMGIHHVEVYKRPKVALIITGSELVAYDAIAESHQLRDSNRPMLAAAIQESGGIVSHQQRVEDNMQATSRALEIAEAHADIIIFSGGVSVGPHDHVKDASLAAGYEQLFWRVRQKPGKPLFFARKNNQVLLGLPGNPVSAYMCFKHYGSPLIQKMRGGQFSQVSTPAVLAREVSNPGDRARMVRVSLDPTEGELATATVMAHQGSHMLSSISTAQGYFMLPENTIYPAQSVVAVYTF